MKIQVDTPLELREYGDTVSIRLIEQKFVAKITARTGTEYAWIEQNIDEDGVLEDGDREGTIEDDPAINLAGDVVEIGAVVDMYYSGNFFCFRERAKEFKAKITSLGTLSSGKYVHPWEEVEWDGNNYTTLSGGRTGSTAVEMSNRLTSANVIVDMWRESDGDYVFRGASLILDRLGDDVAIVNPLHIRIPYAAGISSSTYTGITSVGSNSGGTLTKDRQTIGGTKIFAADAVFYSGAIYLRSDQTDKYKTKIVHYGTGGSFAIQHVTIDGDDDNYVEMYLTPPSYSGTWSPAIFGIKNVYGDENIAIRIWDSASTFKDGATGTDSCGSKFYGGVCWEVGSGASYTDEEAQDSIGGILDDGTTGQIDFTYDDSTPKISGVVKPGSITLAMMDSGAGLTGTL